MKKFEEYFHKISLVQKRIIVFLFCAMLLSVFVVWLNANLSNAIISNLNTEIAISQHDKWIVTKNTIFTSDNPEVRATSVEELLVYKDDIMKGNLEALASHRIGNTTLYSILHQDTRFMSQYDCLQRAVVMQTEFVDTQLSYHSVIYSSILSFALVVMCFLASLYNSLGKKKERDEKD